LTVKAVYGSPAEVDPVFSGIIQQRAEVVAVSPRDFGQALDIDPGDWASRPARGDSIAVNGCCLTVARAGTDGGRGRLGFDVVRQTLDTTTLGELAPGAGVNLETAVTPQTMLSGHLVQGHVDGVGVVAGVRTDDSDRRVRVEPPPALSRGSRWP
jgi:riboflavin synthase